MDHNTAQSINNLQLFYRVRHIPLLSFPSLPSFHPSIHPTFFPSLLFIHPSIFPSLPPSLPSFILYNFTRNFLYFFPSSMDPPTQKIPLTAEARNTGKPALDFIIVLSQVSIPWVLGKMQNSLHTWKDPPLPLIRSPLSVWQVLPWEVEHQKCPVD